MPSTMAPGPTATGANSDPDLPADFDPGLNPILARHWFGIEFQDVRDLWWRRHGWGIACPQSLM